MSTENDGEPQRPHVLRPPSDYSVLHDIVAALEALALAFEEAPARNLGLRPRDFADRLRLLIDFLTELAPQTSETLPRYVQQQEFWDHAVIGCLLGEGHHARMFGAPIRGITQTGRGDRWGETAR